MDFMIGCNYWASNAGTEMWVNWDEKVIRDDLDILSQNGVEYMRVFPNWRDFQPVVKMYGGGGDFKEYRLKKDSAASNPYFLDDEMLNRFDKFCDICREYGIKLIVSLLTGWMSGGLFIPEALNDKNLFTDPAALMFEQKFIKGFVLRFKDKENIYAWDLGNECNCMSKIPKLAGDTDCDISTNWTYIITDAIKAADGKRPIMSGMANLGPERAKTLWSLQEHAECVDIMTTHPYTLFHPHCSNDYFASIRSTLHATAETRYYADISKKPCFVEEIGTLGNSLCCDDTAADFMNVNLYSNWANGNNGLLWWCANEQSHLKTPPYIWGMLEVELGMISADRKPKKYLTKMKEFSDFLKSLDFKLPRAKTDAVCIIPCGYEQWDVWGIAFSAYIMAKQAKINLKFAYCDDELPDAGFYILPSINTDYPTLKFYELKEKVRKGATLYISNNCGFMQGLKEFAGVEITDSANTSGRIEFSFKGIEFKADVQRRYKTKAAGAKVISYDKDGNVIISKNSYGKGSVGFVNVPIEKNKMNEFDAFSDSSYLIYDELLKECKKNHIVLCDNPNLCITHHFDKDSCYVVIINHSSIIQEMKLKINGAYRLEKAYKGCETSIGAFDAAVLKYSRI